MNSILTSILSPILSIIDKAVPDKTEANRLKAEIEKAVLDNEAKLTETMKEIAVAEIQGNWFQSSWRPLFSYALIFMFLWIYVIKGVVEASFGISIISGTSDDLVTLGTIWSAIYGFGRSFEKTGSSVKIGGDSGKSK